MPQVEPKVRTITLSSKHTNTYNQGITMADMSDAKAYIDKRTYTATNGKGDKNRTTNYKALRDNWPDFRTPTMPKFKNTSKDD